MCGKVILLAVICVSFVQVRGSEDLNTTIKEGLGKVNIIKDARIRDFAHFDNLIKEIANVISRKTEESVRTVGLEVDVIIQTVNNVANSTKEKAKKSDMPQSVLECIDGFESQAKENIDLLRWQVQNQFRYLEKLKMKDLESYKGVISKMEDRFYDAIRDAENRINKSKNVKSVESAVADFKQFTDSIREKITWAVKDVQDTFNDYEEDINNYYINFRKNLAREKSVACRNIRLCILDRNPIRALFLHSNK